MTAAILIAAAPAWGAAGHTRSVPGASGGVSLSPGMLRARNPNAALGPLANLWDQYNSPGGNGVGSQNFESMYDPADDEAADDFAVPGGTAWLVSGIDVQGFYSGGPGPARSVNVNIYANGAGNLPGTLIAARPSLGYTNGASFEVNFTGVGLLAGRYWASAQANMDFGCCGYWYWYTRTASWLDGAAWRNPIGGWNIPACRSWARRSTTCLLAPQEPDQVYRLRGTVAACLGETPTVIGTDGGDVLAGTEGRDVIAGLGGNDVIRAGGGDDLVCGGAGNDQIFGENDVFSGAGGDWLLGEDGHDVIDGGPGYIDLLWGGPGDDMLIGNDFAVVTYLSAPGNVTVNLESGQASGDGNDAIRPVVGTTGVSVIFGSHHHDTLIGNRGANIIFPDAGNDTVRGGDGVDIAAFTVATGVYADLRSGQAQAGAQGNDTLESIEGLGGDAGNDVFIGNQQGNVMFGFGGHDTLHGGAGSDTLRGGDGDDRLFGEAANDLLEGNAGTNTLEGGQGDNDQAGFGWIAGGLAGQSGVVADLAAKSAGATGPAAFRDTIVGVESLAGSPYADTLRGDSRPNVLSGSAGGDVLIGRSGRDFLNGGLDVDRADAGPGRDYCLDTEVNRRCERSRIAAQRVMGTSRTAQPERISEDPSMIGESLSHPTCSPSRNGGGTTAIQPPQQIFRPGTNHTATWRAELRRKGSARVFKTTPLAEGKLVGTGVAPGFPTAWTKAMDSTPITWPVQKRVPPGIYYWVQRIELEDSRRSGKGRVNVYYQPPGKATTVLSCDFRRKY